MTPLCPPAPINRDTSTSGGNSTNLPPFTGGLRGVQTCRESRSYREIQRQSESGIKLMKQIARIKSTSSIGTGILLPHCRREILLPTWRHLQQVANRYLVGWSDSNSKRINAVKGSMAWSWAIQRRCARLNEVRIPSEVSGFGGSFYRRAKYPYLMICDSFFIIDRHLESRFYE